MRKCFLALILVAMLSFAAGCDRDAFDGYGIQSEVSASAQTHSAVPTQSAPAAPDPTVAPSGTPTVSATAMPTASKAASSTTQPAAELTPKPTATPTPVPTAAPSTQPINTVQPTAEPIFISGPLQAVITAIDFHQEDEEPRDVFSLREEVTNSSDDPGLHIDVVVDEQTIVLDAKTGEKIRADFFEYGDSATVFYGVPIETTSGESTGQAQCFALLYTVESAKNDLITYVQPASVTPQADGSVIVRGENADFDIQIPADLPLEVYGDSAAYLEQADLLPGRKLIIWCAETADNDGGMQATRVIADLDVPENLDQSEALANE